MTFEFPADTVRQLQADKALLLAALEKIAELEGDCDRQRFRLTRFQASQVARQALNGIRRKARGA